MPAALRGSPPVETRSCTEAQSLRIPYGMFGAWVSRIVRPPHHAEDIAPDGFLDIKTFRPDTSMWQLARSGFGSSEFPSGAFGRLGVCGAGWVDAPAGRFRRLRRSQSAIYAEWRKVATP